MQRILAVAALFLYSIASQALDGVSAELGQGQHDVQLWRVGAQWNQDVEWLQRRAHAPHPSSQHPSIHESGPPRDCAMAIPAGACIERSGSRDAGRSAHRDCSPVPTADPLQRSHDRRASKRSRGRLRRCLVPDRDEQVGAAPDQVDGRERQDDGRARRLVSGRGHSRVRPEAGISRPGSPPATRRTIVSPGLSCPWFMSADTPCSGLSFRRLRAAPALRGSPRHPRDPPPWRW